MEPSQYSHNLGHIVVATRPINHGWPKNASIAFEGRVHYSFCGEEFCDNRASRGKGESTFVMALALLTAVMQTFDGNSTPVTALASTGIGAAQITNSPQTKPIFRKDPFTFKSIWMSIQ